MKHAKQRPSNPRSPDEEDEGQGMLAAVSGLCSLGAGTHARWPLIKANLPARVPVKQQFQPNLLLVHEELEHVPIARRHPLQSVSSDFKNLQVPQ